MPTKPIDLQAVREFNRNAAALLGPLCDEVERLRAVLDAAVKWHDSPGDEEAEGALVIAIERAHPKYWP